MELDRISTVQFFNTRIWQQSRQQIFNERLQSFKLLNRDVFYSIKPGPPTYSNFSWKTYKRQWHIQTFVVFH